MKQLMFSYKIFVFICLSSSSMIEAQVFGDRQDLGLVQYNPINEASGTAASRKNSQVLWTHNDSGDSNRIFAMNRQGGHLGVYWINGATNRDWEDSAVGPGPIAGEQYLYIGDIGDNDANYNSKFIYRVLEPNVSSTQNPIDTTLSNVEKITFQYPDGKRDAETLMIDPFTKDIYIVSKREDSVRVYLLVYPQSTTQTITAAHVATLSLKGNQPTPQSYTVGGDIASNGYDILIKTRSTVYYWFRSPGQNLWEAFSTPPLVLPYIEEPQGEAVGWAPDVRGYYTISEETGGVPAHLYFYPRIDDPFFFKVINIDVLIEGLYNGISSVQDTVAFELRALSPTYLLIDQDKILVNNAGHGGGKFLSVENGVPYYVVVKHRNSIETWSALPQQFSLGALNYNFTSSNSKAYGNNLKSKGSKWCIFSGDVNQDGYIDIQDLVLVDNDNYNLVTGYKSTDVNGDGIVDEADLVLTHSNSINYVSKLTPITLMLKTEEQKNEKLKNKAE